MKTKLLAATIVLLATAQAIADVRMTERDDPVRVEIGGELYIGTEIAYKQGGYETGHVSRVAPGVEDVLMSAMRDLLDASK